MRVRDRVKKSVLTALVAVTLCSCAGNRTLDPETTPPETLYNGALDLLVKQREYTKSIAAFDDVDRYYPYSRWAIRAQIMQAFADYLKREYDDAVVVLDRFLQLYPGNAFAPYAYYLKAMCFYAQISDTDRGQKMTRTALEALNEVVSRFPNTPYAVDAEKRIVLAVEYLAAKNVKIGMYYLKRDEHIAALNRFADTVRNYQRTRPAQEALYRLTETYLQLGLDGEAQKSAAILGYNHPNSPWYARAFALMKKYVPDSVAEK